MFIQNGDATLIAQLSELKNMTDENSLPLGDLLKQIVKKAKPAAKPAPDLQALTDLCQALLSANEFLYVD